MGPINFLVPTCLTPLIHSPPTYLHSILVDQSGGGEHSSGGSVLMLFRIAYSFILCLSGALCHHRVGGIYFSVSYRTVSYYMIFYAI